MQVYGPATHLFVACSRTWDALVRARCEHPSTMASHGMDGNATLLGAGAGTDTDTCAEGQVIAYISLVAILVISFALGSSLSTDSLKGVFASHKRGIACGWASQFGKPRKPCAGWPRGRRPHTQRTTRGRAGVRVA